MRADRGWNAAGSAAGARPRRGDGRRGPPALDDPSFAPRNFLRAAALLLLKERPDHGYGLAVRLRALGVADGNAGAIYRALRTLETAGLLESHWTESASGPPKRVYVVTDAGDDVLHAWTDALRSVGDALSAYLYRYARVSPVGEQIPGPAEAS